MSGFAYDIYSGTRICPLCASTEEEGHTGDCRYYLQAEVQRLSNELSVAERDANAHAEMSAFWRVHYSMAVAALKRLYGQALAADDAGLWQLDPEVVEQVNEALGEVA